MSNEYHIEYKGLEKRKSPLDEVNTKRKRRVVEDLDGLARVASCMDEWTRTENSAYEKELDNRGKVIEHLNEQYRSMIAKYCILAESVHDMAAEIQLMQRIIDDNVENYPLRRHIITGPYQIPQVRLSENRVPNFRLGYDQFLDVTSDTDSEDIMEIVTDV